MSLLMLGRVPYSFSALRRALFGRGEQGAWYDPSDLSTLFQDSAGTTPVTAVGQPVGRMLDKSGRGNHATQSTAASRPTLQIDANGRYYLACDGTDDGMVTASIDFTGTDKMTVVCGVRKLSDAAIGVICEMSANSAINSGVFGLIAPPSSGAASYYLRSTGTTARDATSPTSYPAPITNVIAGIGDIGGDSVAMRINGTQVASSSLDQGTGNYGNYPLYLFRRGGTTLPANINFYGLIIRGAATSARDLGYMEKFMNSRTGAY